MRPILLLALSVAAVAAPPADASKTLAQDAAYFEALGAGILFSFNYDRRLDEQYGMRIGGYPAFGTRAYWLFAQGYVLTNPDGTHHLEAGAGLGMFAFAMSLTLFGYGTPDEAPTPRFYVPLTLGYRLQPFDGGFVLRLSLTPLLLLRSSGEVIVAPYGGASLGWAW